MAGTRDRVGALAGCVLLLGAVLGGCGSTTQSAKDAGDAALPDAMPGRDGASDSNLMCTYADGGAQGDGAATNTVCPTGGCPTGTVCVYESGGAGGPGGNYCAPIPSECHGTPTCGCMANCVCTHPFGSQPETCTTQNGSVYCDNGIR